MSETRKLIRLNLVFCPSTNCALPTFLENYHFQLMPISFSPKLWPRLVYVIYNSMYIFLFLVRVRQIYTLAMYMQVAYKYISICKVYMGVRQVDLFWSNKWVWFQNTINAKSKISELINHLDFMRQARENLIYLWYIFAYCTNLFYRMRNLRCGRHLSSIFHLNTTGKSR
jgi:hypothetical protein